MTNIIIPLIANGLFRTVAVCTLEMFDFKNVISSTVLPGANI